MVVFTSITANYIPKARILARSVKRHLPAAKFVVILCDEIPKELSETIEPFDALLQVHELGIPVENLPAWIFSHSVVELCTAVKGAAFLTLFEKFQDEKVMFLDPDIVVLDSLEPLETLLDSHSVLITPHLVEPDDTLDAIADNEVCALAHGVYNFGFLAVRNSVEGKRFATWWRDRLTHFCYDDIPRGLFTDQRWGDLVPAFFPDAYIVRDKIYNVATWNLSHRKVDMDKNGKLFIEGQPIRFYHFSGFDSGAQEAMLTKYGKGNQGLFKLREWYLAEMENEGQSLFGKRPSCYGFYQDGEKISQEQRVLYRGRPDLKLKYPDPFATEPAKQSYVAWFKKTGRWELKGEGFRQAFKKNSPKAYDLIKGASYWAKRVKNTVPFLSRFEF